MSKDQDKAAPADAAPELQRAVNRRADGSLQVTRLLPGPVERVWAYLTEADKRARWFAGGAMTPAPGAEIVFEHDHDIITDSPEPPPEKYKSAACGVTTRARIVRAEAPHLLVFDWMEADGSASLVTIALEAAEAGTRLTLTHERLPQGERVPVSAGWHAHLDILEDKLAGRPRRAFWSHHMALEDFYAAP